MTLDIWMYWVTAAVFTLVGYSFKSGSLSYKETQRVTKETIDTLIDMGFIRTRGVGEDVELVKWNEDLD